MNPYDPPTKVAGLPTPKRLARGGYIAYLYDPSGQCTNAAYSHAGCGRTPTEAIRASRYWANQIARVRVVPISKAPVWAIEEATEARLWDFYRE